MKHCSPWTKARLCVVSPKLDGYDVRRADDLQHTSYSRGFIINMRFENSFWRISICVACLALTACERPATNAPAPAPSPAATPTIIQNEAPATATPAVAGTVALATPAPATAPVVPGPTPISLEGKDFEMTMLNGSKIKLSKLLGRKKVVIVNFWATWCGPCRKEIPDLIALTNSYKGKNVEIVGLTVENPAQAMTLVKDFTKENQLNYQVGFAPMPLFMTFNGARPGGPIPQTFIFGKDGTLRYHIPGMRVAFKDYVAQAIDAALKS